MNLIKGHPRNISTKLFENRPDTFGEEDFLSFHYFFLLVAMETRIMDGSCFWPINMAWRNLIEGQSRNISTKLFENQPNTFGGEDFLSFHYSHMRHKSLPPGVHVFLPINLAWRNLIEGLSRNISTKHFENWPNTFVGEDYLSFHYSHIRQNSPAPWWPCFSTNQLGLKECDRGSPKQHFYKIIWKSAYKAYKAK